MTTALADHRRQPTPFSALKVRFDPLDLPVLDQPAINRLLNPRHASRPAQFDAAFAALGKRLVLSLENAA